MVTEKINILYYEPTSGYGGSSRCLLGWLKKLDNERYNPIVAAHYNGPAIQKIKELEIATINIPYKPLSLYNNQYSFFRYLMLFVNFLVFDIPTAIFICNLAKKYNARIFHLNAKVISVIPGIIAARLCKKPCICHLHDIKIPVKREKLFARWIDCFVVLTEKALTLYKKEYSHKRLELIQNGLDLNDYKLDSDRKKILKEFNIRDDEIVVGMVGRLVQGKGFSDFLKAAKILNSKKNKVKFVIVGSANIGNEDFETYLKKLTQDFGLKDNVVFTGWREDVKSIMSIFDVLVQASSTFPEGFGLTVIEAMALGKPLVVTDVPGPSEIIIDGETGYVVPPANPEKLAEALENLISNRELALKMGEMGKKRIESCFNLEIIIKKLENLYISLLKNSYSDD